MKRIPLSVGVSVLAVSVFLAPRAFSADDGRGRIRSSRVAYHYIGRVALNFQTGSAVILAYFTHLDSVPADVSLFAGLPSESTAFFTLRADVSFKPLAGNGDLGGGSFAVTPALIQPGTIKVYFTANPKHDWNDPNSFSNGQLIATFSRELEQLAILGPTSTNTASAALQSSVEVTFNDTLFDLGRLLPRGVTNVTAGASTPLAGSTATTPILAFAGYGLAIGK
jgi:hypothetical protein